MDDMEQRITQMSEELAQVKAQLQSYQQGSTEEKGSENDLKGDGSDGLPESLENPEGSENQEENIGNAGPPEKKLVMRVSRENAEVARIKEDFGRSLYRWQARQVAPSAQQARPAAPPVQQPKTETDRISEAFRRGLRR